MKAPYIKALAATVSAAAVFSLVLPTLEQHLAAYQIQRAFSHAPAYSKAGRPCRGRRCGSLIIELPQDASAEPLPRRPNTLSSMTKASHQAGDISSR